jgi:diguanylate cyclase (GGDEF)-like protein/PAS domain S-box-containing protein
MAMRPMLGVATTYGAGSAFVSASLVATALLDGSGAVVAANSGFADLTGIDGTEAGVFLSAVVAAADQPALLGHLLAALAGHRIETELMLAVPGRSARTFRALFGPSPDGLPHIVVQLPAAPGEREDLARLRAAVDGAGQGVWDHDLAAGTVYYSPTWYRMRGFEPGENVDAELGGWYDRLHPDDRPRIEDITARQNMGELNFNAFEYRERHRGGHYIWVLSRGRPIAWNDDGSVIRTLGTDTDITALKTAEAELAAEKERLRITLHSIADGVISTDAGGRVTFINPAGAHYTGWSLDEAAGRPITEILHVTLDDAPLDLCGLRTKATSAPLQVDGDAQVRSRHGASMEVTLTVSQIRGDAGLQGFVFVFQDVTHSRALRRRLAHGATHDQLTDLPNRGLFENVLAEAVDSASRDGREHALCYIDLDRFKAVNDGAGHAAGDEVLRRFAGLLLKSCRARDFAARVGGDEFVLILHDCPVRDAVRVATKLIATLAAEDFTFDGQRYRVGTSVGIAAIRPGVPTPVDLTREADLACYRSKAEGRGRVTLSRGV